MSQERTERWTDREVEKDRQIVAAANAEIQPGILRVDSNWLIQFVNIATHYINLSEQRREERDSNQWIHIQALEEIDRLNAVSEELTAKVQERDETIKALSDLTEANRKVISTWAEEIERLRANLAYAHEALGAAYDAAPDNSAVEGILFLAYNEVGSSLKGAE